MNAAASSLPARPTTDADRSSDDSSIHVSTDGTTVVIAVERTLDLPTGEALLSAATAAVATGPSRLDIDLRALESYTPEGADALVSCRALGAQLVDGLHYRTGRGPGRDALLAAYSAGETEDGGGREAPDLP